MRALIILLCLALYSGESYGCNDTVVYIQVTIMSKSRNPVVMSAMANEFDFSGISFSGGEAFLKSLYEQSSYVPSFLAAEDVLRDVCGIDPPDDFVSNQEQVVRQVERKGYEVKIVLRNGENVFLRIAKLQGHFYHCNTKSANLPSSSLEADIGLAGESVRVSLFKDFSVVKLSRKEKRDLKIEIEMNSQIDK